MVLLGPAVGIDKPDMLRVMQGVIRLGGWCAGGAGVSGGDKAIIGDRSVR